MEIDSIKECLSKIKDFDPHFFNTIFNELAGGLLSLEDLNAINRNLQGLISNDNHHYPKTLMIEIFTLAEQIEFYIDNSFGLKKLT